ncbi:MAG: hypothetical protein EP330_15415 [Deltaproteobacteria bacterium]|nr:MAG: hypothetical protein EP330_15415 [Deltaproteobacteria bacterium]
MSYRLNLGSLRGMDALTIEITVADALRRPLGGLTASTLADLMALTEVDEGLDGALKRSLAGFATRIGNEIRDLPPAALKTLVDELDGVEDDQVPETLRMQLLDAVAANPGAPHIERVSQKIEGWDEASVFSVGSQARKVMRAPEARRDDSRFKDRRVGGRGEPATRRTRTAAPKAETRTLDLAGTTDPDRDKWIEQSCLERLAGAGSAGLLEAVLLAGVRHGARTRYPDLGAHEVKSGLNRLKDKNKVRFSAGRWSQVGARRW